MTFLNKDELTKNIKLHSRLSFVSMFSMIAIIFSFGLFVFFAIGELILASAICFFVCCLCIAALITISRYYKKETARLNHCPYEVILAHTFEYDEVKRIFLQRAKTELCRDFQKDSAFFCFLNNRFLIVGTPLFDKSDFDAKKKKINKSVNKEFRILQWISRDKARKMMRTNIIVTDEINEPLYNFLSSNSRTMLRRTEGIINFAIAGDRLIIPPLFGETNILEVGRYKKSIKILINLLK